MASFNQAWILTLALIQVGIKFTTAHNCTVVELVPPGTGKFVNCSQKGLSAIPKDLPYTDVTILDLSQNAFGDLKKGTFSNYTDLKNLTLAGNSITTYSAGAFEGLANLEQLDLSLNWMESLPYSLCDDMPKLNNISVNDARLGNDIANDVFSKCQDLSIIYMVQSGLLDIGQVFTNLSNLESLYLTNSIGLSSLDPNPFSNNPKLAKLDLLGLASSGVSRLDKLPAAITQVKSLQTLRLSNSVFTTFSKEDTQFFDQLEKLYGTGNPYTCDCSTTDLITWMQSADNIIDKDTWDCRASCANCPDSYLMKDYNVKTCGGVHIQAGSIWVVVACVVVVCILAAAAIVGVVVMKRKKVACFSRTYARM